MAKPGRPKKSLLDETARTIGKTLALALNRLDSWRAQRHSIAADVRKAVDTGNQILAELGEEGRTATRSARGAFTRGRRKLGRRKGFTMSKAARAKIAAAQRARWAKKKAGKKD